MRLLILSLAICLTCVTGKIHHWRTTVRFFARLSRLLHLSPLQHDNRRVILLSSFGFAPHSYLDVYIANFSVTPPYGVNADDYNKEPSVGSFL